ncbi:MAG: protoheme IX farnesyltransferase [Flavobacteriales bacterium]|nr:protoheme IX farnesyltransferase [Flavobacteriales bacterium]|tara:strand:- start:1589 stop:2476 length:888 start_codon:yes stop_codon:yes gene_type:complete
MKILIFYFQLLKFRLSFTVVFSAATGYLLGVTNFHLNEFILLIIGGFLVTGSANGFNQVLEKDFDKLMKRTTGRPLPTKNLSILQAVVFSSIIGAIGLYCLNFIHPENGFYGGMSKSSFFGLISMLLYVLSYTPLKRISTICIFIGAIPGAIPFLLGWVAATDNFGIAAGTLFAIQFFWQFPHFIAISWVLDDEYKKAGFKMMFGGEKGKYPAAISVVTSIIMMIISVLPYFYIETLNLSNIAFISVLGLGIWFTLKSIFLFRETEDKSAKKLMIASFLYLPLMQIIYVFDKYLI